MRYSRPKPRLRAACAVGLLSVCAVAAAFAPGASANAQAAEQAGGPLTLLSTSPSSVMMMTPPEPSAGQRMETWQWMFLGEPHTTSTIPYDTMAVRFSLDCAAMTGEHSFYELYRDGSFVYRSPTDVQPFVNERAIGIICSGGRGGATFADHRAARDAALTFLDGSGP